MVDFCARQFSAITQLFSRYAPVTSIQVTHRNQQQTVPKATIGIVHLILHIIVEANA